MLQALLVSFTLAGPAREVRVAAASDLTFALEEIGAKFHAAHPDIVVKATYGSSGVFLAQIENGAPFDVFLSADAEGPRRLAAAGKADPPFPYAIGRIVLWARRPAPFNLKARGSDVLGEVTVKHIAIANPRHAPYGRAAEAALTNLGLLPAVKDKLVLGESVAQSALFVESGAADVGVIAKSLASSPAMAGKGDAWDFPPDSYPRIEQWGVVVKSTRDVAAARAFGEFLLSSEARRILRASGFAIPGD